MTATFAPAVAPRDGAQAIPRVASMDEATFAGHRRHAVPVVVSPAASTPLARALAPLADPEHVRSVLADAPLLVRNGSAADLLLGVVAGEVAEVPYGAFADLLAADPDSPLVCSEHRTPDALAALVPPPPFAADPRDAVSDVFLAAPGSFAHLHYDGDLRDVVMVQLFGRKRYVLIDPAHTAKVLPLSGPGVQRTSGMFLEHLDPDDLDAFLRYTDAHSVVLEPGELLFMPAGWWHFVEYLDVSLSVNHRLGRSAELRTLAEEVPVPSIDWLALAQLWRDPTSRTPVARAAWDALADALAVDDRDDPAARAARLEQVCFRIVRALDAATGTPRRPATVVDLDRHARLS